MVAVLALFYAAIPASVQNSRTSHDRLSLDGLRANLVLLLPAITCLGMALFKYLFERGVRVGSVGPQYSPPADLSALEVGVFLDNKVDARDVVAGIVDLGVRGYVRIEPLSDAEPGKPAADYSFRNLQRPFWATELPAYDAALMQHIFQFGRQPCLSELRHGLAEFLPQLRDGVFAELMKKKLYRIQPQFGQALVLIGGGAVLALVFGVAQLLDLQLADSPLLYLASFALSAGIVYLFSCRIGWRSAAGNRTLRELLGFKDFLRRTMADRLRVLPLEQVEKMLPYAIALGVERAWVGAFKDLVTKPLSWFLPAGAEEGVEWSETDSAENVRLLISLAEFMDPQQLATAAYRAGQEPG